MKLKIHLDSGAVLSFAMDKTEAAAKAKKIAYGSLGGGAVVGIPVRSRVKDTLHGITQVVCGKVQAVALVPGSEDERKWLYDSYEEKLGGADAGN